MVVKVELYIYNFGSITTISNSTFSNNTATEGSTVYNSAGDINIVNSILYGNDNCSGTITSLGHNIDSGDTCGFDQEGDVGGVDGYETLHEFELSTGGAPDQISLLEYDEKFYGMTYNGGSFGCCGGNGVIFEYDPDLDIYNVLHEFEDNSGKNPHGSLIESNEKLYGMTQGGGGDDYGVIFSLDPVENVYSVLHEFDGSDGEEPYGSLIEVNNKFYGMTSVGGSGGYGVIFEYDPIEDVYAILHEFDSENGSIPYGSLLEESGILYGMTYSGGSGDYGTIFEYNLSEETFAVLHEFDGVEGGEPYGSLISSEGKFYGMTYSGGADNFGVLFEYNPSDVGDEYEVLYEFNGTFGENPKGSLINFDGKFYGMTLLGGLEDDQGVVFSYDPINDTYQVLYYFEDDDGSGYNATGSFIESDGFLFGATSYGGAEDYGTIFSFDHNPLGLDPSGLADNGGSVETIALAEGSVAIDAGDDEQAPETDARGYARVGNSDIGAYEYGATPPEETCRDGIQNQNETSIDEGGACEERSLVISSGSSRSTRTNFKAKQVLLNTLPTPVGTPSPVGAPSSPSSPLPPTYKTLKLGMTDPEVKLLQIYLNTHGFPVSLIGPGSIGLETNFFGPKTKAAVILFQKAKGLVPDGMVGPKTKAAMI